MTDRERLNGAYAARVAEWYNDELVAMREQGKAKPEVVYDAKGNAYICYDNGTRLYRVSH